MPKRHPTPRLIKIHRSYTAEEIASLYRVHKKTIRNWVKDRLPTNDDRLPMLILGRALVTFLQAKRAKNKRPCQAGEIHCVRCRAAQKPAGAMADYPPVTATVGNLVGICPSCESMMYRRASTLPGWCRSGAELDIILMRALPKFTTRAE
jgi:hypothetical protein